MRMYGILSTLLLICVTAPVISGCGAVHVGTSTNDPAPNLPLLGSGGFSGQVGGSALMYGQNGSYVLRLVSFSAPSVSNLQAIVTGGGSTVAALTLVATTGTKNYSFSAASGLTFNAVTIHSATTNTDYGVATIR